MVRRNGMCRRHRWFRNDCRRRFSTFRMLVNSSPPARCFLEVRTKAGLPSQAFAGKRKGFGSNYASVTSPCGGFTQVRSDEWLRQRR